MKIAKLLGMCLALSVALPFVAPTSRAQSLPTPQIMLVGSTGAFTSMAVSSVEPDPITGAAAPCTGATSSTTTPTNFWTQKNGTTSPVVVGALDARSGTPHEGGNIWVSWNADAASTPYGPHPIVCSYMTVDSIVGQRMLFGTNGTQTGTLILDASEAEDGTAPTGGVACGNGLNDGLGGKLGGKAVPQFDDSATRLPCPVWNILVGAPTFNGAATDIRPEDALFGNSRALAPCAGACGTDITKAGMGYGPYPTGSAVQSAFDGTSSNAIAYNITGNDPISGSPVTPGATIQIGAYPMMIFANVHSTANPGDFGNVTPTNINSHVLGQVFSATNTPGGLGQSLAFGGAVLTSDVTGNLAVAGSPLNIVMREPTSGTFNTFEWQVVRNQGFYRSQEWGVDPSDNVGSDPANCTARPVVANCGNPYFIKLPGGGTRSRAIGTGQLVNAVGGKSSTSGTCTPAAPYNNGLLNGIGYAFWSFATYADACVHADLKYLQVDGVDPLYASPSNDPEGAGVFPKCTTPGLTCDAVPFTNMVNGSYRNWNIIRMVMKNTYTSPAFGPSVPALVLAAQDQAHTNIPDFVPFVYCTPGGGSCTPAAVDLSAPLWVDAPTGVSVGLTAFRSHYTAPCVPVTTSITICPQTGTTVGNLALNGTNQAPYFGLPPWTENEGDMAGAVLTVQSDIDSLSNWGGQQLDLIQ